MSRQHQHPHLRSAVKTYPYLTGYTALVVTLTLVLQIWQAVTS